MIPVEERAALLQGSIDNVNYAIAEGRLEYAEYLLRTRTRKLLQYWGQGSPTLQQYLGNDLPGTKIEGVHYFSEYWLKQ